MAVTETYSPRPNLAEVRALNPADVVVAYDRPSDTLVVHFYGRGRAGINVPSPRELDRDFVYLRFDPDSDQVIGFEIEDCLALFASQRPEVWSLVEVAELRGITPEEITRLRAGVTVEERRRDAVGYFVGSMFGSTDQTVD